MTYLVDSGDSGSKSRSGDSGDMTSNSRTNVATTVAAIRITFDFGLSNVGRTRVVVLETHTHFLPKGYCQATSAETVPETQTNGAVVFEDLFTTGLCMPPHLVLAGILQKFRV
jgi:hypothetical protein